MDLFPRQPTKLQFEAVYTVKAGSALEMVQSPSPVFSVKLGNETITLNTFLEYKRATSVPVRIRLIRISYGKGQIGIEFNITSQGSNAADIANIQACSKCTVTASYSAPPVNDRTARLEMDAYTLAQNQEPND